jgi:hypothetical protein
VSPHLPAPHLLTRQLELEHAAMPLMADLCEDAGGRMAAGPGARRADDAADPGQRA